MDKKKTKPNKKESKPKLKSKKGGDLQQNPTVSLINIQKPSISLSQFPSF